MVWLFGLKLVLGIVLLPYLGVYFWWLYLTMFKMSDTNILVSPLPYFSFKFDQFFHPIWVPSFSPLTLLCWFSIMCCYKALLHLMCSICYALWCTLFGFFIFLTACMGSLRCFSFLSPLLCFLSHLLCWTAQYGCRSFWFYGQLLLGIVLLPCLGFFGWFYGTSQSFGCWYIFVSPLPFFFLMWSVFPPWNVHHFFLVTLLSQIQVQCCYSWLRSVCCMLSYNSLAWFFFSLVVIFQVI